ncbi:phytoene dehydrogenase [Burkholderia sp. MSMB1072]|uniref:phytoene desaturase family protein n=1 Tax=unclassified Burkholderia TaxID=2613784 RepID=UPI0007539D36|nr:MULTISPECIES: NAD(P)/FAD-dependent oxidoreductase [unclassified Burkholderia]KVH54544.1 phytoene dehydrogenase [Burkholderia sp. MSMB1072]KWO40854.1 phytoene dehydrogenase [Burkholderia sp. MSMB1459WGS]
MTGNDKQPVVVIGAGLAGLAAALMLARGDKPVVIVEASDEAGGCCSTTTKNGFTFNNGAMYVAVPSLIRASFRRLGLDFDREVPMVAIERPHVTHLDNGTTIHLSGAGTSYVEGDRADSRTRQLRDGLGRLRQQWGPAYRTLVDEVLPHEPSLLRTLSKLWRYLPRTSGHASRLIEAHFADADLQSAVASTLLYTGQGPDRLPATQIVGLIAMLEEGFHLPRAGMGVINSAMTRELSRRSVPIRFGAPVREIVVEKGAVRGIVLADGERIATDCVVATCSGFDVVRHLLPDGAVPRRLAHKARTAPLSHRAISIQVGCSGAMLPRAFMTNRVPSMRQQAALHVSTPGVPHWLAYTCPSLVLPELAPNGKAVLELYAPATGIHSVSEWTRAMTQAAVDDYLSAIQAHLPGLCIESVRVADPRDFASERHLYEGALYGMAPGTAPDKFFPHRAGLRGLYLGGQTTFPGYGVPTAMFSGIQAAEAAMQDMRGNA